jgi:outer membrane protein TolC
VNGNAQLFALDGATGATLATEVAQQREASDQATQALSISTILYQDGLDNYLSVAVAQVTALAAHVAIRAF